MGGQHRHDRRHLRGIRLRARYHPPTRICAHTSRPISNRRSLNPNTPNTRTTSNHCSPNTDTPNLQPAPYRHAGLPTRRDSNTGPPRDSRIRSKP